MRIINYLISPSRVWAIEEGAWQEMVHIAERKNDTIEAVEAALGRKLDNKATNALNIDGGVATIPVKGPIVKYGDIISEASGVTSVSRITKDFETALKDESVKAILLDIDSPGGEANGINELSEFIYQSRGIKPIHAYISGMGCSAAYWIASAADRMDMDETAMAGSIGVACVVKSNEQKEANDGITTYKFVSEGSENKRPDLDTDEGKAVFQANLDSIAKVFRSKVARNRSNDETSYTIRDVIEKFNRGGTLIGEQAVSAGLVDGLSSYQAVLENLQTMSGDTSLNQQENIMADTLKVNASEEGAIAATASASANDAIVTQLAEENKALQATNSQLVDKYTALGEQFEVLRASFEATQEANLKLEAVATVDKYADRFTPAQKETAVATYLQAAKDDKASPVAGFKRVDNLIGLWENTPVHNLTVETLSPEATVDLASSVAGEEEDDYLARAMAFVKQENAKLNAGK